MTARAAFGRSVVSTYSRRNTCTTYAVLRGIVRIVRRTGCIQPSPGLFRSMIDFRLTSRRNSINRPFRSLSSHHLPLPLSPLPFDSLHIVLTLFVLDHALIPRKPALFAALLWCLTKPSWLDDSMELESAIRLHLAEPAAP